MGEDHLVTVDDNNTLTDLKQFISSFKSHISSHRIRFCTVGGKVLSDEQYSWTLRRFGIVFPYTPF